MYFVYIIYSEKIDKYYIGYTSDLHNRVRRHNANSKGFTNTGKPWTLVYFEQFDSKKEAANREKYLKAWKSKKKIEALIKSGLPTGKNGSEHPDLKSGGS